VDAHEAGRSGEIVCDEILTLHSDYLDGALAAHEAARVQWHLATCAACARYDRVVRRGLDLVRELPGIQPSDDFQERLQHRIFHVQDGATIAEPRAAGGAAALAVASVIALLAWSPLLVGPRDGASTAVADAALESAGDLLQATPLASLVDPWAPAPQLSPLVGGDAVMALVSFPGPYSPLRVEPPVHGRTIRTISSEYVPVD
jgi:anti-sigma factor RsiW